MKVRSYIKRPLHTISPFYRPNAEQAAKAAPKQYEFKCSNCNHSILIEISKIIDLNMASTSPEGAELLPELHGIFEVGLSGKAHDGGNPVFIQAECSDCRQKYFFYFGVQEVYNSLYAITEQGIVMYD